MSEQLEFDFKTAGFAGCFDSLAVDVHANAVTKGFWQGLDWNSLDDLVPAKLALIHSEVSEALEAHRNKEPTNKVAEELADVVIRIMDLAQAMNLSLGETIINKHIYNLSRPHKHGNKRY